MKKLFILQTRVLIILMTFFISLINTNTFGTIIAAKATGSWNSTTTWNPAQIPLAGDIVTIAGGYDVTIPSTYTAACATLTINGNSTISSVVVNGTLNISGAVTLGNGTNYAEISVALGKTCTIGGATIVNTGGAFKGTGTVLFNSTLTINNGSILK